MLSLGIFLCMIFVLYSLNTSDHFIKGTDYFLIIALVHFHMSFGFRIIQYFESLSWWSLKYLCTYYIFHRYLYSNVDMCHEMYIVYIVINGYKIVRTPCGANYHIFDSSFWSYHQKSSPHYQNIYYWNPTQPYQDLTLTTINPTDPDK